MRVIEARNDGASVVEVEAPSALNPLARAYKELSAIGVRLVHMEVRVATDCLIQRLHLLEPDESPLSRRRLLAALAVLATICQTSAPGPFSAA